MSKYPQIVRAALIIAYNNGMINRHETEEDFLLKVSDLLTFEKDDEMQALDHFISGMSDENLEIMVDGEQTEAQEWIKKCPHPVITDTLFNNIFEI